MKIAKRLLMVAGAVALAVLVGAVLTPKTAHAVVAAMVDVVNDNAHPVPNQDVENPAHSPKRLSYFLNVDQGNTGVSGFGLATIPAGKRMVVEYVSASCGIQTASGVSITDMGLVLPDLEVGNGTERNYFLPVMTGGSNGDFTQFYTSQLVRLYADGSGSPEVGAFFDLSGGAPQGGVFCSFEVSGYTVNKP